MTLAIEPEAGDSVRFVVLWICRSWGLGQNLSLPVGPTTGAMGGDRFVRGVI